eukprot:76399-Pyramimonas_sp.AAC.1
MAVLVNTISALASPKMIARARPPPRSPCTQRGGARRTPPRRGQRPAGELGPHPLESRKKGTHTRLHWRNRRRTS